MQVIRVYIYTFNNFVLSELNFTSNASQPGKYAQIAIVSTLKHLFLCWHNRLCEDGIKIKNNLK